MVLRVVFRFCILLHKEVLATFAGRMLRLEYQRASLSGHHLEPHISSIDSNMSSENQPAPTPTPEPPPPPLPNAGRRRTLAGEQAIVVVQQPSIWRGILSWLGWIVAGLCLLSIMTFFSSRKEYFDNSGGIQEKYHSLSKKTSTNKIAVLKATGVITSGDGFVKRQIDRIKKDDDIKGIVVRIDSPGGTVYGSDFIFHHLKELKKERDIPMVVSMGSVAASGGYYIAMAVGDQEKSIYAEPLTTTGSIGVIIPHYNLSGLMDDYNVVDDSLATHERKKMLSISRPMTDDDREVLGKYIGHAFDRFKDVIKEGRPKFRDDPAALDVLATGEVFTAKQAKESGLIDEVGFIEDAIDRVLEMADLKKDTTRVITYKRPVTLADAIAIGKAPGSEQNAVVSSVLKLSNQKAYYIHAPLANLIGSERD